MTRGKRVYPMMQIDWKKELDRALACAYGKKELPTDMFPPSSLICIVTTASPIQTRAKTPEKTMVFCSLDAVMESRRLRSKQNIRGPLRVSLVHLGQSIIVC